MNHNILSLNEFYSTYLYEEAGENYEFLHKVRHLNVFKLNPIPFKQITQIHCNDFYMVALTIGTGRLHTQDRVFCIDGRAIIFCNPSLPHYWEPISGNQEGYFCLFNEQFLASSSINFNYRNSPFYNSKLEPIYSLTMQQTQNLIFLFKKMMDEIHSPYIRKDDVLYHYLHLIIHEALKAEEVKQISGKYMNASSRISTLFMEILESQFPIGTAEKSSMLRTPTDFAKHLSIHVNHLNRSVKEVMGCSTSDLISTRIAKEAGSMLRQSDNSIADIAHRLGFEHTSNFNTFFKKQTQKTPKMFRK